MRRFLFSLVIIPVLTLSACAPRTGTATAQPPSSDQVPTTGAPTAQALPSDLPAVSTSGPSADLLPHALYYLSNDGLFRRDDGNLVVQVYRMERDGKTTTRLTDEQNGMDGFDVSPVDGSVAFVANNQLSLIDADGSNRRVLVDTGLGPTPGPALSFPAFSPDGKTLAYRRGGLNFYDLSTGVSSLAIEDQYGEPMPDGSRIPIETYWPVSYSPDGTKLLVAMGQWEAPPLFGAYDVASGALVRPSRGDTDFCCGGPTWAADGSSFYGATTIPQFLYRAGEIWQVDSGTGEVTALIPFDPNNETMNLSFAPHLGPDGQWRYFFGDYSVNSGYFEPPVLQLVRSAADGMNERTVLRDENFIMMNEALWSPDGSFFIAATSPSRDWQDVGVLELYHADGGQSPVWLAPIGKGMKWGP